MKRPAWLLLTILLWTDSIECFQGMALLPRRSVSESRSLWSLSARRRRESLDDEEGGEVEASTTGIPQLPAFGGSSFSNSMDMKNPGASFVRTDENHLTDAAFASPKFKLQYTCNVCDTRNSHMVSRLAYRKGVVIAICKGCKSKHLIADNFNETPGMEGGSNIEDYFKAQGMEDSVNRVGPEVFDLEHIIRFDSNSGCLVGEDGGPVLE